MPPSPNTEEQFADAQKALDEFRIFLRGRGSKVGVNKKVALKFQLENLEDMLRVVTDSRYARNLASPSNSNGDVVNTSAETLQYIISTVQSVVGPTSVSPSDAAVALMERSIASRILPSTEQPFGSPGPDEGHSLVQNRRYTSGDTPFSSAPLVFSAKSRD
jgi:hypothetical protein